LTDIAILPCDVFIWRGPRPVLYANRGADLSKLVARSLRGISLLVHEADADLLREALAESLPRVLSSQDVCPGERGKTAYSIAAKVLVPLFERSRSLGREGLTLTHKVVDAITSSMLGDEEIMWAMVGAAPKRLAAHTHAINTAVYGIVLAKASGIGNAEAVRDLARGGLLHDIGKNRVAPGIVDKAGPLDEAEWQAMQGHVKAGYEMVVKASGHVPSYAHIIAEHHERADGSGYPAGRGGSGIAVDSQLVGIADAFDALTCKRVYRDGVSAFEALRLMRVAMHGQFSDDLLRSFIKLLGGWQAAADLGGSSRPAVQ